MKILIADKFPESHADALSARGHELTMDPALEGPALPGAIAGQEVLIVRSTAVTQETLDRADALRLVIRAGSGYNTIEFAHAATKGIAVANCPGMNAVAVAELAMGLILALDRRIPDNVADARSGVWNKKLYGKAAGLKGRTLGLVGIGKIGGEVVRRALAFGMDVIAYDPFVTAEQAAALGTELVDDLYEVARRADVVTVHVPRTAETTHLIGERFFAAMKDGALFVHTSRGGVVDDAALARALDDKGIRAGLDVYEDEPDASAKEFENPLARHPGVIPTHHIGASTEQAQTAVADEVLAIIDGFAATGEVRNRVN